MREEQQQQQKRRRAAAEKKQSSSSKEEEQQQQKKKSSSNNKRAEHCICSSNYSTPMAPRPKNLSTDERNIIAQFILQGSSGGKPKRGKLVEAQNKFHLSKSTIHRIWKEASQQQTQGLVIHVVSKKFGRKRDKVMIPDYVKLKSLSIQVRTSIRKMEGELNVSRGTLHRWARAGLFKIHTSALKPMLTADNKFLRMRFSLEAIELDRVLNQLRYSSMHNIVHIDEKWFYITKGNNRYYLAPDEEEPYRACKSKKFIGKIMFLCAVSRPILSEDGGVLFDGKIGIFPFTGEGKALRNSKNRPKGTKYTKAVDAVTREVMKKALLEKVPARVYLTHAISCFLHFIIGQKLQQQVIPAIRNKWPAELSKDIHIQQDNAKPHITDSDADFREAATRDGFNIKLVQQPPNSPDTNINDLGFFNAIQAIQQQRTCKNVDDLIKAVEDAFHELAPATLNKVFLTLQCCLTEIMKFRGHNKYKIPHMGKDRLIRAGTLPLTLQVDAELVGECIKYLVENGQVIGIEELVQRLGMQQLTGIGL